MLQVDFSRPNETDVAFNVITVSNAKLLHDILNHTFKEVSITKHV